MFLFILTSLFDHLLKIVVVLGVLSVLCILCVWTVLFLFFAIIYLLRVLEQRSLVNPFQGQAPWAEYLDFREPEANLHDATNAPTKMTIVESEELDLMEQADLESQHQQEDDDETDVTDTKD